MKKIVVIGGGTGLSNLLPALKNYTNNLTAVVTMVDDGWSTGRLRKEFGVIPPGDVRKCLVALANDQDLMTKVFQYRFDKGRGISGHSLGNLLIVALEHITGSFSEAINQASHILSIKGRVLPATFNNVNVIARLKNGKEIFGQDKISHYGHKSPIKRICLKPSKVKANPEVLWAIKNADLIVIGPGSLCTSLIPNFLIKEITSEVVKSKAKKIYVCNIATERGETENYTVSDHVDMLTRHSHPRIFDICLVNENIIANGSDVGELGKVHNITTNEKKIGRYKIIKKDIINIENPLFHNGEKLAKAIMEV